MKLRAVVCVMVAGALSTGLGVSAQDGPKARPKPKAEPVLQHVPAGAMGFVLINHVGALVAKADAVAAELKLDEDLGPPQPGRMMTLIQAAARLGPGFNPNGGFAVFMPDPKAYGIDLPGMIRGKKAKDGAKPRLPWVMLIPGGGVAEMFPNHPRETAGRFVKVTLRAGPAYAVQVGGYVAVSPNDKALDEVLSSKKNMVGEFAKPQAALLAASDLAVHVNMKAAGEAIRTLLKKEGAEAVLWLNAGLWGDPLSQADSLTASLRIVETGFVIDALGEVPADGRLAKVMNICRAAEGVPALLGRLPNLPCLVAVGAKVDGATDRAQAALGALTDWKLSQARQDKAGKALKSRVKANRLGLWRQLRQIQVWVGIPDGDRKGVVGVVVVARARDSAKLKALLTEHMRLDAEMDAATSDDPAALQQWILKPGAEKLDGLNVDVWELKDSESAATSDTPVGGVLTLLGAPPFRVLVTAPDKETVVVCFGAGGKAMLAEAVKAAKAGGKVGTGPADAEATKHVPNRPCAVVLIRPAGVADWMQQVRKTTEPEAKSKSKSIKFSEAPVALGMSVDGGTVRGAVYIPKTLVKDLLNRFVGQRAEAKGQARTAPATKSK